MKIGDSVRFLNAVGGGKISRIDAKTNLVYVEDEDGFEIPVLKHECVIVNTVNQNNFPKSTTQETPKQTEKNIVVDKFISSEPVKSIPVYETKEGEVLRVLLAFIPDRIKELQTCGYDCVLINDCNYFLQYHLVSVQNGSMKTVACGLIEPNMQETIVSFVKDNLNDWENIRFQAIPFKQDKPYNSQKVLDVDFHINLVKFYKLHSFAENEYFEEKAMLLDVLEEKQRKQLHAVSATEIKQALLTKEAPVLIKKKKQITTPDVIEVDLHIHELLESTVGMTNAEMLTYQLDVFHKTLAQYTKKKGQKIVFIHGKGEGVLRKEIERILKKDYKQHLFQDASFQEYGFGATMVTIR